MDPQPDVIHKQIEETRSSLTDKLETLEAEVKGTVQTAKETVESAKEAVEETLQTAKETVHQTISSVKETVQNATETVKRTFDIPYQVDRHPWGMMALSFVSGVLGGALVGGRMNPGRRLARRMAETSAEPYRADDRPGFVDRLAGKLGDEFERAKDLAVDTLAQVVSDVARKAIPALGTAVEEMMARTAAQAGAPPPQYGEEPRAAAARAGYGAPPLY